MKAHQDIAVVDGSGAGMRSPLLEIPNEVEQITLPSHMVLELTYTATDSPEHRISSTS